jgi:hypothetical protein
MNQIRRLLPRISLAAAVTALLLGFFAVPASAAVPFVVCDSFPAPSISASAGTLTMHYFHQCNTVAGVTSMEGDMSLNGPLTASYIITKNVQATAASVRTLPVGGSHGQWSVTETLIFSGNFTTGPAPHGGCGRTGPSTVTCRWTSTTIFG